mmetsp:Transcript_4591/g.11857  ORF Transcript_4591/g.11857 Transcript_4591/m.11857 type:complete len:203 (+) Transcript_4591:356-964(+)
MVPTSAGRAAAGRLWCRQVPSLHARTARASSYRCTRSAERWHCRSRTFFRKRPCQRLSRQMRQHPLTSRFWSFPPFRWRGAGWTWQATAATQRCWPGWRRRWTACWIAFWAGLAWWWRRFSRGGIGQTRSTQGPAWHCMASRAGRTVRRAARRRSSALKSSTLASVTSSRTLCTARVCTLPPWLRTHRWKRCSVRCRNRLPS